MIFYKQIIKKINLGAEKYVSVLKLNKYTPGFSILIKKDNEIIYEKSIGRNIISSKSPGMVLSSQSLYLCASLTKPVISRFFIDLNKKYPELMQTSLDNFFSVKKKAIYKTYNYTASFDS